MRVYLAGPIDNTNREQAGKWRERAAYLLQGYGVTAVCPLRDGAKCTTGEWTTGGRSLADCDWIVTRDLELIDNCDAVLARLDEVSEGTCMEIFYAWQKGIPVVGFGYERKSAFMRVTVAEVHSFLQTAVERTTIIVKGKAK